MITNEVNFTVSSTAIIVSNNCNIVSSTKILYNSVIIIEHLATNPCSVPLSPGTGNASLHRWYYNADDRDCLPFLYNGIRGNQNNFQSQTECSRTCPGQTLHLKLIDPI